MRTKPCGLCCCASLATRRPPACTSCRGTHPGHRGRLESHGEGRGGVGWWGCTPPSSMRNKLSNEKKNKKQQLHQFLFLTNPKGKPHQKGVGGRCGAGAESGHLFAVPCVWIWWMWAAQCAKDTSSPLTPQQRLCGPKWPCQHPSLCS